MPDACGDNELAEQQGVDPSLIGRTLRLATLAPDITQAILAGQEPYGLSIRSLTKGFCLPAGTSSASTMASRNSGSEVA